MGVESLFGGDNTAEKLAINVERGLERFDARHGRGGSRPGGPARLGAGCEQIKLANVEQMRGQASIGLRTADSGEQPAFCILGLRMTSCIRDKILFAKHLGA